MRERGAATILAIAESLSSDSAAQALQPSDEAEAASLASGNAGLAVFFFYLAQSGLTTRAAERAEDLLAKAHAIVATVDMTPSLYAGFTGVAWATEHLNTRNVGGDDDATAEIDEALRGYLRQSPWADDYDLVTGLVGIGVYALERLPRQSARALLELVIDRLHDRAERTPAGLTWHTSADLLPPRERDRCPAGQYNLGVAHGVPGVLALLGHACAAGVARTMAKAMLHEAVAWLLAQQLPMASPSRFASSVVPGTEPVAARTAWCYGDPGIAAALLSAARGVGHSAWESEAVALARAAADRRLEETRVRDAGLCHGAIGLAHIFNRMYQATGDARLADAGRSWFERSLEMQRPPEGVGGFQALAPSHDGTESWFPDPSLLTGAAGIGLALLAAITPIEPAWDRMLLLSGPISTDREGRRALEWRDENGS